MYRVAHCVRPVAISLLCWDEALTDERRPSGRHCSLAAKAPCLRANLILATMIASRLGPIDCCSHRFPLPSAFASSCINLLGIRFHLVSTRQQQMRERHRIALPRQPRPCPIPAANYLAPGLVPCTSPGRVRLLPAPRCWHLRWRFKVLSGSERTDRNSGSLVDCGGASWLNGQAAAASFATGKKTTVPVSQIAAAHQHRCRHHFDLRWTRGAVLVGSSS